MDKTKQEDTLLKLHELSSDKSVASVLLQDLRESLDNATATIEKLKKENEETKESNRKLENVNRDLFLRLPTKPQEETKETEQNPKKGINSLFE